MRTPLRSTALHATPPHSAPPRAAARHRKPELALSAFIRRFRIYSVLAALSAVHCVGAEPSTVSGMGDFPHEPAAGAVENLWARSALANEGSAFRRAASRLEAARALEPACMGAPIYYVFVPREEWVHDWYADRITGETWRVAAGWLSAVKDHHRTAGYDPHTILEHELLHALVDCSGGNDWDNHSHVGPWWDGLR